MQTIGKTTNKMDFPKTWTDILLKSISGKTNYTIDVKIGTKRIETDDQDQRESPKKRRKQSNPTRISANGEHLNHELDTESLRADKIKHEVNQIEPPKDLRLSNNQNSFSLPLNLTTCESQKLSLDGLQQVQYSNNVYEQNGSSTEMYKNSNSPYQSLMQSIPYFEKKDPVEYSSFKSPPCNSAANAGQTSVQIFNPEAFCDQCNKEFCNKYFLKTHKANKHGVFLENVPSAGSALDQTDRYREPVVPATRDFSSSNTNDASAAASTSTLFKNTLVYPQPPPVNANMYASKNMVNNQTRAFCNICQKEFCNKYFVKRHKAKIHGIIDDGDYKTTTIDEVPLNFKMNLQIKNELLDLCVPDCTFDKDDKAGSPIFHAQESSSQAWKTHAQSQPSVCVEEPEQQRSVESARDHNNIETETSDDEHCANWKNCYGTGAPLAGDPARVATTNGDQPVMRDHIFSKPSVETVLQQPVVERATKVLDLMATKSNGGERGVGKRDDDDHDDHDDHDEVAQVSAYNDIASAAEDGPRVEMIGKVKLLTLHNLFFKLNGGALENTARCYVCNTTVDGSLKAHIFDKHEHLVNELMNDSLKCEWSGGAKGAGGASTSSKNSAENYDDLSAARERNDRRPSAAALSSFCRICNKELCNKYFMKTHMERMHGISIQNGNHIGGVVCDICNKELCSKYFLRVHRLNSHGVGGPENGSRYWPDADNRVGTIGPVEGPFPSQPPQPQPPLPPPPPPQPPVEQDDDDGHHRYYKHYTESCGVCLRRFRSAKWLSAHLLNDHGEEGRAQWRRLALHSRPDEDEGQLLQRPQWQQQPKDQDAVDERTEDDAKQYRCSYCPFTTSVLSFLFVHEKFHVTETIKAADAAPPPPPPSQRAAEPVQPRSPDHRPMVVAADRSLDTNGNDLQFAAAAKAVGSPFDDRGHPMIPIGAESSGHEPFIMQSFFLENCSVSPSVKADASGRSDSFHSSLVYLPVKEKLTSTVNVFFKLTPT